MKRRLLNLLTALSLLLCVAVVALWVRSYAAFDWVMLSEAASGASSEPERGATVESRVVFSWRGTFGYIRSEDFTGTARTGSYPLVLRPRSPRDMAQNAETMYLVADMERRWNDGAKPVFVRGGFQYVRHDPAYPWVERVLAPYWFALMLAAIAPVAYLGSRARRKNRTSCHACSWCAYNLTGNVSGVCPECGEAVPAAARPRAKVTR